MKPSCPDYWFLEICLAFVSITTLGAFVLAGIFGRDWSGSLLPLVTLPFQILACMIAFGMLFAVRGYTNRASISIPAVIVLAVLSSIAMLNWGVIRIGGYHGP